MKDLLWLANVYLKLAFVFLILPMIILIILGLIL